MFFSCFLILLFIGHLDSVDFLGEIFTVDTTFHLIWAGRNGTTLTAIAETTDGSSYFINCNFKVQYTEVFVEQHHLGELSGMMKMIYKATPPSLLASSHLKPLSTLNAASMTQELNI